MTSVDRYQYLWDGTEAGWVLLRINRWTVSLSVVFADEGSTAADVKALRRAIPSLGALSAADALASLRGRQRVELGEFEAREARRVAGACRKAGLVVLEEAQDRSGYVPFNESTNSGLVIEDDALHEAVMEAALQHGVAVMHVEA
jgi:hypothetical protein